MESSITLLLNALARLQAAQSSRLMYHGYFGVQTVSDLKSLIELNCQIVRFRVLRHATREEVQS